MLCVSCRQHKTNEYVYGKGQCPRRTSGVRKVIMVLSCLQPRYAAEDDITRKSRWQSSQRNTMCIVDGQHQGMDRPVTVVTVVHLTGQANGQMGIEEASGLYGS